jgi:hypothetical protein
LIEKQLGAVLQSTLDKIAEEDDIDARRKLGLSLVLASERIDSRMEESLGACKYIYF